MVIIHAVKMKKNKAIELDLLTWWLIAIICLVILILAIIVLREKGINAIEYIKDLFRFKSS